MNFDEYEKRLYPLYAEFAETVRTILEKAIAATQGVPRPQSIQCRAKTPSSLKIRLASTDSLDIQNLESARKDLAGARLIFYTNTDVKRFLNSHLIPQNFSVDWQDTKVHHPTKENDGVRYQAIHYTVCLSEDRSKLPEYSKFDGLRCEIQIQTILNHAWSETSHDILYKSQPSEGFGSKAIESITNRFNQIMDKYLLPAGYEFQKVQHDYERLQLGKELFDRDVIESLQAAQSNNERYELLISLKNNVLPNYDDIPAILGELCGPLVAAAITARNAPTSPRETPFGDIEGHTANSVAMVVVEIFESFRYVDVELTFSALCEIYRGESNPDVKKRIIDAIQNLAKYDLHVWKQVGPQLQMFLVDTVETLEPNDRNSVRPILLTVWGAVLDAELRGTTWNLDSVTLHMGAVPASAEIKTVRSKAITGLFGLYHQSSTEDQKREVILALREATQTPQEYSNELLALTLTDNKRIVDFLSDNATNESYELLEHLEHQLLFDYRRARHLAVDEEDNFACRSIAQDLMRSIERFRDGINLKQEFVHYKTLVGYESTFAEQWEQDDFDFVKAEEYRSAQLDHFVDGIGADNEEYWYALLERCAATKSNDLATFPHFGSFIVRLAKAKPEIAERYVRRATDNLLGFLPAFLGGLFESGVVEIYQRTIEHYLSIGKQLAAIARHWRNSKPKRPAFITSVLNKAILGNDDVAVIECLLYAMEGRQEDQVPAKDKFFIPAIRYLIDRGDARWVNLAWHLFKDSNEFFAGLKLQEAKLVLASMLSVLRIEYQAERILTLIAKKHAAPVWDFFAERVARKSGDKIGERYEAFPYRFHGLEKELSRDPKAAVSVVRKWYDTSNELFRFRGGRLLSAVFPGCGDDFARELGTLVDTGTDADANFVLAVMQNYHGEPSTHEVLRRIVARYPADDRKLSHVSISFDNTGVVGGEFGFVEALRRKKEEMKPWCEDSRLEVRTFAERHIQSLDVRIASEQQRAEEGLEMRKREFDSASSE